MNYNRNAPRDNRRNDNRSNSSGVVEEILAKVPEFMSQEKDSHGDILIECAEKLGKLLADEKMTASQIRKLFNEVKQTNFKNGGAYKVNLMKAKFAYVAGRFKEVKNFRRIADKILSEIGTNEDKFRRFQNFFEAVVAYHRNYGGKE